MPELNRDFFIRRADAARALAVKASDPDMKTIHERMARDYAELAKLAGPTALRDETAEGRRPARPAPS